MKEMELRKMMMKLNVGLEKQLSREMQMGNIY